MTDHDAPGVIDDRTPTILEAGICPSCRGNYLEQPPAADGCATCLRLAKYEDELRAERSTRSLIEEDERRGNNGFRAEMALLWAEASRADRKKNGDKSTVGTVMVTLIGMILQVFRTILLWVVFPAAIAFWIWMAWRSPRATSVVLFLATVIPAIVLTSVGLTRINVFDLMVIEGFDLGSPRWTVPVFWALAGLVVFSLPLGLLGVIECDKRGKAFLARLRDRDPEAALRVETASAYLPLLLLVPLLAWSAVAGLPGMWLDRPEPSFEIRQLGLLPIYGWLGLVAMLLTRTLRRPGVTTPLENGGSVEQPAQ